MGAQFHHSEKSQQGCLENNLKYLIPCVVLHCFGGIPQLGLVVACKWWAKCDLLQAINNLTKVIQFVVYSLCDIFTKCILIIFTVWMRKTLYRVVISSIFKLFNK